MAFTKDEKSKMMTQYSQWFDKSQGMFLLEYAKMNMPVIDGLRAKVREAGGEAHVVKNTLMGKMLKEANFESTEELTGTTLVGFAFDDPAAVAKVISDAIKDYKDSGFKVKGGYLDKNSLSAEEVKQLGSLPPLPVMRAKLLGTIMAPASQLVRTLAEPGRGLAAVVQAHVDAAGAE